MSKLKSRKLTVALFIFYLAVLFCIVMLKNFFAFRFLNFMFTFQSPITSRSINLVPFGGMLANNGTPDYNEVIYNALAFVPFGIFLGMLRKKRSFISLIAPIALTSLFFEVAQYVFALGASDITDVIANTVGGAIGLGVFFVFHKVCKENVYKVVNAAALVFASVFVLLLGLVRPL